MIKELLGKTLASILFNWEKLVSMMLCAFACFLYLSVELLSLGFLRPRILFNHGISWNVTFMIIFYNGDNEAKLTDLTLVRHVEMKLSPDILQDLKTLKIGVSI